MLVSYQWLTDYLGTQAPDPQAVADLLTFHSFEIEGLTTKGDDTVIDVDVLPNRSSDCLCHRGIAREIATLTGTPLAYDPLAQSVVLPATDNIAVDIQAPEACPRFTAALITNITVGPSPKWLVARLAALGQRSINNIVDATNYVMYAIGQPLHAYDATKFNQVDGQWKFVVRYAREGEEVSLLAEGGADTDRIVTCAGTELLIVDGATDMPIGLAGVKGGRYAGVDAGTTQIIIEAAHFHPTITRKTARGLGIVIDASKRFENEPSRELPLYAQAECAKLIADIAGGVQEGVIDVYLQQLQQTTVRLSVKKANNLLGLELSSEEMAALITRTGSTVELSGDTLMCTGPFERTDLNIAEDFIEEIGRIYGYNNVQAVVPDTVPLKELNKRHYYSEKIRSVLVAHGCSEVITSSFRNKDEIQLLNALASDKSYLRSTLRKNITEALDKNAGFTDLLGTPDTRIFELGTVFAKSADGVTEEQRLAVGVRLKQSGYSGKEDAVLEQTLAAVQTMLDCDIDWTVEKGVAECSVTELLGRLPEPAAYEPLVVGEEVAYQQFSVFQHMSRDIAMWVPADTTAKEVEEVLRASAGELCVRVTFVDEFAKDGRTSLAFRLVFQSKEKTLTDSEVNDIMDAVYAAVGERGWEVR